MAPFELVRRVTTPVTTRARPVTTSGVIDRKFTVAAPVVGPKRDGYALLTGVAVGSVIALVTVFARHELRSRDAATVTLPPAIAPPSPPLFADPMPERSEATLAAPSSAAPEPAPEPVATSSAPAARVASPALRAIPMPRKTARPSASQVTTAAAPIAATPQGLSRRALFGERK